MTTYIVSLADNPTPAWVRWNPDNHLPCFTFIQPEGVSLSDAKALKAQADICCGGTLRIVKAHA